MIMKDPTVVYCDNSAARDWTNESQSMHKAKHKDIRYHFCRECVENGFVDPEKVASENNRAHQLTKPLLRNKFQKFRDEMGVVDLSQKE